MFADEITNAVLARIPGVFIPTLEEDRAISGVMQAVLQVTNRARRTEDVSQYAVIRWSPVSMVRHRWKLASTACDSSSQKCVKQAPEVLASVPLYEAIEQFTKIGPSEALKLPDRSFDGEQYSAAVLIITDVHVEFSSSVRQLREALWQLKGSSRTIILMGPDAALPETLGIEMMVIPLDLPDAEVLKKTFAPSWSKLAEAKTKGEIKFEPGFCEQFERACLGLTLTEARKILAHSMVAADAFDAGTVAMAMREKVKAVRSCAALEYKEVRGGLDAVGGLVNVKRWISEVGDLWAQREAAEKYGCDIPSGLLLAGVPGTGKTYLAEKLAGSWGLPLLMLDIGALFGPLLGNTEANFRRFKATVKACRPCVVFIDELEKAIGGGGNADAGASDRLKGGLLTWIQDKPRDIFLVASANDMTKFRSCPEILRAGRFDQIFWFDLPCEDIRCEIFSIHFKLSGHEPSDAKVRELISLGAKLAQEYSPAEIKAVVKAALRMSFRMKMEHPTPGHLKAAIGEITPLSKSMGKSLEALRQWALSIGAKAGDERRS
jgi:ATP-dependent 26S proteasome regulatory subunit